MTGPKILFVVDAGPTVGGGHVMRSLTLARALNKVFEAKEKRREEVTEHPLNLVSRRVRV